jgi:DNA-binding protein H-NS
LAAKKVAAKYRDPASGKTWSGRGVSPKWFDKSRPQDFAL